MSRIKFVGGQEDGNYMDVDGRLPFVRVPEKTEPETRYCDGGAKPNNDTFRVFTYVRRGNVMVFDA